MAITIFWIWISFEVFGDFPELSLSGVRSTLRLKLCLVNCNFTKTFGFHRLGQVTFGRLQLTCSYGGPPHRTRTLLSSVTNLDASEMVSRKHHDSMLTPCLEECHHLLEEDSFFIHKTDVYLERESLGVSFSGLRAGGCVTPRLLSRLHMVTKFFDGGSSVNG